MIDGTKRVVEKIMGRRKLKSSYEYEVQWVNLHPENNTWIPRDELCDMGFEKMVNDVDAKEAAAQGLYAKPLTSVNIAKHLEVGRAAALRGAGWSLKGGRQIRGWGVGEGRGCSAGPVRQAAHLGQHRQALGGREGC